jgi:hypothetical protein
MRIVAAIVCGLSVMVPVGSREAALNTVVPPLPTELFTLKGGELRSFLRDSVEWGPRTTRPPRRDGRDSTQITVSIDRRWAATPHHVIRDGKPRIVAKYVNDGPGFSRRGIAPHDSAFLIAQSDDTGNIHLFWAQLPGSGGLTLHYAGKMIVCHIGQSDDVKPGVFRFSPLHEVCDPNAESKSKATWRATMSPKKLLALPETARKRMKDFEHIHGDCGWVRCDDGCCEIVHSEDNIQRDSPIYSVPA